MSSTRWCLISTILLQAVPADAAPGLRGPPQATPQEATPQGLTQKSVEKTLLTELSGNFNGGAATEHVAKIQELLAPMYKAIQKEDDGTLSHTLVRYMLHRYFVQQHGWFIRGLEPSGAVHNILAEGHKNHADQSIEWVPSYIQEFLERLQGGQGITLRELAVLGATLEDLIHKEAVERLELTFSALEMPLTTLLDEAKLRETLEVYMMVYMLGGNFTVKGPEGVLRAHGIFASKVKGWGAVQEWMHAIQLEVAPTKAGETLDFSAATRVVEEIGRRYGTYNDAECNMLKSEILEIESTKAGRVRLTEFYKKGLSGVFDFNEKIEYLRTLGTLDETNASDPLVIVPNYVSSRPNCLVASGFYVVCCRNECEDLLGAIEKKFEAPTAKPHEILELVSAMSSPTVTAPRKLSDLLVQRLNSIALNANDEGEVPLHGRLFALWMHHAFPRECPYPQPAGTTSPQTPDEWMQATGHQDARKTEKEMQMIVDLDGRMHLPKGPEARDHHHLPENELPWDDVEESPTDQVRATTTKDLEARWRALEGTAWAPQAVAPQDSLFVHFTVATVAFFIAGLAICAWKVAAQGQDEKHGAVSTVQQFVNSMLPGRHSTELPLNKEPVAC